MDHFTILPCYYQTSLCIAVWFFSDCYPQGSGKANNDEQTLTIRHQQRITMSVYYFVTFCLSTFYLCFSLSIKSYLNKL